MTSRSGGRLRDGQVLSRDCNSWGKACPQARPEGGGSPRADRPAADRRARARRQFRRRGPPPAEEPRHRRRGPADARMYTDACVAAMGRLDAAGLERDAEPFEGVGKVVGWVRDLEGGAAGRAVPGPRGAGRACQRVRTYTANLPAPPAVVWIFVTSPGLCRHAVRRDRRRGAAGVGRGAAVSGTVNHLIHGQDAVVEEVLDWRPYYYVTYRCSRRSAGTPPIVNTFVFELDDARGICSDLVALVALGEAPGDPRADSAGPRRIHRARARGVAIGDHEDSGIARGCRRDRGGAGRARLASRVSAADDFPRTA